MDQRYDHPAFIIKQQAAFAAVQAPAASLTAFGHFRCRNKCVVTHVVVTCTSLPSAITTFSLQVMRGTSTIAAHTVTSFSALGDDISALIITLASSGTLESVTDFIALELDSTEKGKFDIVYEYNLLADVA
tara:strand:- start:207 stop:599 length:393 start_codon:yes stop_codon:yes gene_type:complete